MRRLVSVQIIDRLEDIANSDSLQVASVLGWKVVVRIGQFAQGDKVVYLEIDSFLPELPEYEFLRKSSYCKLADKAGFRLKTIKLRGQVSQGLLLPLTDSALPVGCDMTELLGITKWEPQQTFATGSGCQFPSFVPKTSEERVQNADFSQINMSLPWSVTEKLDGTSATFYVQGGEFGVCSRNLDLDESNGGLLWQLAYELDLRTKMLATGQDFAVQGEVIGPKIQGNKYSLTKPELYVFTVYDIAKRARFGAYALKLLCDKLGLKAVPEIAMEQYLPMGKTNAEIAEALLASADGVSKLHKTAREGLVFRQIHDQSVSFKVISNKWLLKSED